MNSDINDLTKDIEDDPFDAWSYFDRAQLYRESRMYTLAIDDLNTAIALEPDEPAFWRKRGLFYELLDEVASSQRDLNRAIELDPKDAESYSVRGWCSSRNHDFDAALADLDRAVALDPLYPVYRHRRAQLRLKRGELPKALEDFDEAIRLDPVEAQYHYERAMALLYGSPDVNPAEALPSLEEAIRLRPEFDWYRMERGFIRFHQERWMEAAEDFTRQNFRHQYRYTPYLGAERVIWICLARHLGGMPALGVAAVQEYLEWYLNESKGQSEGMPRAEKLQTWPVPLARFLAEKINETEVLASDALKETDACHSDIIRERINEYHFVLAQLALATGRSEEMMGHLERARGIPSWNPMSWIVKRQLSHRPASR